MHGFRRWFALLFVAATLLSALHELIHHHEHEVAHYVKESCPLYLIANFPVVLNDPFELYFPEKIFEIFLSIKSTRITAELIPSKSRSPPPPSTFS
jgi:hypothetical protein